MPWKSRIRRSLRDRNPGMRLRLVLTIQLSAAGLAFGLTKRGISVSPRAMVLIFARKLHQPCQLGAALAIITNSFSGRTSALLCIISNYGPSFTRFVFRFHGL